MQHAIEITDTNQSATEHDAARAWVGMPYPLLLDVSSLELTDRQLEKLFADNSIFRFEVTAKGELVIMAPSGEYVAERENELAFQVTQWAKEDGTGIAYGATGGFRLPNGALLAPDASWVTRERRDAWRGEQEALPEGERRSFPNLWPDFVLKLRSPGDTVIGLQRKMQEYLDNGARLGWLIDPINKRVHIYRPGEAAVVLDEPETVSGDPVLPGFVLELQEIW